MDSFEVMHILQLASNFLFIVAYLENWETIFQTTSNEHCYFKILIMEAITFFFFFLNKKGWFNQTEDTSACKDHHTNERTCRKPLPLTRHWNWQSHPWALSR